MHRCIILLTTLVGCTIFPQDTREAESRIMEAEAILAAAKRVGPKLVERGTIKQEELDLAIEVLETALDLYKAALRQDDITRRTELRAQVLAGIIRLASLITEAALNETAAQCGS